MTFFKFHNVNPFPEVKSCCRAFYSQLVFFRISACLQANKTFVAMRKDMMETKSGLEGTVKLHRESVQKARDIESEIEV